MGLFWALESIGKKSDSEVVNCETLEDTKPLSLNKSQFNWNKETRLMLCFKKQPRQPLRQRLSAGRWSAVTIRLELGEKLVRKLVGDKAAAWMV